MKNLPLLLALILPLGLSAQINSLTGYLNDVDGPLEGETITFINPYPEPILLAEVETDETGFFITQVDSFPLDIDLQIETTACDGVDYGWSIATDNPNTLIYDLYCPPPNDLFELSIYGVPASDDNLTWNFWSETDGELEGLTWSVQDQNFNEEVLTYSFEDSGIFPVFLSATYTNGVTLYTGSDFAVGNDIAENCSASIYLMEDSLDSGTFYFMNASIGEDLDYLWTFGDGTTSTDPYPEHTIPDDVLIYEVCLTITGGNNCNDTECIGFDLGDGLSGIVGDGSDMRGSGPTIVVLSPSFNVLSNQNEFLEASISIFPNPTGGDLNLSYSVDRIDSGFLRLYDSAGRLVYQQNQVLQMDENTLQLELNLDKGFFLIQFIGDYYRFNSKIVVE